MTYPSDITDSRLQAIIREIFFYKKEEIAQIQQQMPVAFFERQLTKAPSVRDFFTALQQSPYKPCIIADVKKACPIHGILRENFDPVAIAQAYERGGATCLSVYTDQKFFQGSYDTLRTIRKRVRLPILCKDFILDSCQVYLAREAGADAVLLIAAILSDEQLQNLLRVIQDLGMNALVQVHTLTELDRVLKLNNLNLVVINNQSLVDFSVDICATEQLLAARRSQLQNLGIIIISESELYTPADLFLVAKAGADVAILDLIKEKDLEQAVRVLLRFYHITCDESHRG
ncbi:indole-3-glycerol phosphate synthase TrpC [Halotia branconii]|uniref:indole-3-glycerol-phosphate synthase n=1 Tax=Halotia branconii CENA392 TaxID=1539056 RepID=A0AAJ6NN36_9CYAN|nr:indole-3-glycerol phosphate synthase TrpC [Halotia branconii]WGV23560.1 indole-3-glycerol phosphate synthase TrpC [Halotia branconii CENA392]